MSPGGVLSLKNWINTIPGIKLTPMKTKSHKTQFARYLAVAAWMLFLFSCTAKQKKLIIR